MNIVVLVPVLGRPAAVEPLVESLAAAGGPSGTGRRPVPIFLCSPGDGAEIAAVRAAGGQHLEVYWDAGPGDYARKINYGFDCAVMRLDAEWVFLGADDLTFHPGWIDAALAAHEETGACVVGTNDLGNSTVMDGHHSTHTLVHRDYAECGTIDEPHFVLHEGYDHQYVDTEFVGTAKWRGTFTVAVASHVEHNHPFWGKGQMDKTYEKALRESRADQQLYLSRRHLWGGH